MEHRAMIQVCGAESFFSALFIDTAPLCHHETAAAGLQILCSSIAFQQSFCI
jgi:hypothetical protein